MNFSKCSGLFIPLQQTANLFIAISNFIRIDKLLLLS